MTNFRGGALQYVHHRHGVGSASGSNFSRCMIMRWSGYGGILHAARPADTDNK